jgi:hypothetical protein
MKIAAFIEKQWRLFLRWSFSTAHIRFENPIVAALIAQRVQDGKPIFCFRVDQPERKGKIEFHLETKAAAAKKHFLQRLP